LVDRERVLHNKLAGGDIQLSAKAARQAYGVNLDSRLGFLGLIRRVLDLDAIPGYEVVVARCFEGHVTSHNYSRDQIRFLRSVREVFLNMGRLVNRQH
jgi:hypothetical protein